MLAVFIPGKPKRDVFVFLDHRQITANCSSFVGTQIGKWRSTLPELVKLGPIMISIPKTYFYSDYVEMMPQSTTSRMA